MEPVVTLNGVQLHPPAPDGTGFELDEDGIQGWWGSPKRKSVFTPRTSEDGSWWSPLAKKDVRVLPVTGTLITTDEPDLEAVLEDLAAICPEADQLYELRVVTDRGTRILNVQCTDEILVKPQSQNSVTFSLSLTAPDPLKYDPDTEPANTLLAQAMSGLDWSTGGGLNWSTGLDWGALTSDGTCTLTNSGTAPSWPKFTVFGPTDMGTLNGFRITDTSSGSVIAFTGLLRVGDSVVIDTNPATRGALMNDFSDVWSGITVAQWFQVPARDPVSKAPGQIRVQFEGSSGSSTPQLIASALAAYF